MLQRFLVIVTTNIWILHCYNISRNCYNLFILLHRLFDVTILLQQLYVVTILLHRIACNCYNVFATGCNNGIIHCYACYNAMLQAFQTPLYKWGDTGKMDGNICKHLFWEHCSAVLISTNLGSVDQQALPTSATFNSNFQLS